MKAFSTVKSFTVVTIMMISLGGWGTGTIAKSILKVDKCKKECPTTDFELKYIDNKNSSTCNKDALRECVKNCLSGISDEKNKCQEVYTEYDQLKKEPESELKLFKSTVKVTQKSSQKNE